MITDHQRPLNKHCKPGFALLEILIILAIVSVVAAMAVFGISRARASLRLSNSARQFASFVERARADAVRRHGEASVQLLDTTTYSVTMDFGANGTVMTQIFSLEPNVKFITELTTITFDWRGRVAAEVSVGFKNEYNSANVNISGAGDITIDSEIFHDASVPTVALGANVSGDALPDPTPPTTAVPPPNPSDSPTDPPTPQPTPTPTPATHPNPKGSPTPTPTPTPPPTPTPTPTATPSPTPTPIPCSISTDPSALTIIRNGSDAVSVTLNNLTGTTTITATSSNNGQIQVTPGTATSAGSDPVPFVVTVKNQSGSVTFSSSCGSKTVTVTVSLN